MKPRLSTYQWRLLFFLSVATFFEGYDFIALSQLLPNLRAELGLSISQGGLLVAFVNLGTLAAYPLVRSADRYGRKRLLMVTIAGYTIFTAASALARGAWDFAVFQFLARAFLVGEWAVSTMFAAEEFPAPVRGMLIGFVQGFSSVGSIVCAGVAPLLLRARFGWRTVYLVGVIPLVLIAFARRGIRETTLFEKNSLAPPPEDLKRIMHGPLWPRVLKMSLIWGLTYVCTQNAITFWKEFAVGERGFSDSAVGGAIALAAVASLPLAFGVGVLLDQIGRRRTAMLIFPMLAIGVACAYRLHHPYALTFALMVSIFGVSAVMPILNAFTTELFPTGQRGAAFAWSNNLLGRITYVLSPIAVAALAQAHGFSSAMTVTCVFPLLALGCILWWLPETGGLVLDEVSASGAGG